MEHHPPTCLTNSDYCLHTKARKSAKGMTAKIWKA